MTNSTVYVSPIERDAFLTKAYAAAKEAGHIWPDYAACEAALESRWGKSQLAQYNNLFGQKQGRVDKLPYPTVELPTHEEINGEMVPCIAEWVHFPDWATCMRERMALLHKLSRYTPALAAKTGDDYITKVSAAWSTDHTRAQNVRLTYSAHKRAFNA